MGTDLFNLLSWEAPRFAKGIQIMAYESRKLGTEFSGSVEG